MILLLLLALVGYPPDFNKACYQEWREGHTYRQEIMPDWSKMPEEIPPEGFEVPIKWKRFCLDPRGHYIAMKDDFGHKLIREKLTCEGGTDGNGT